jgi:hypothetical protein
VPPRPPRGPAVGAERPKAPWSPFPLIEVCVLVGIVCIALGLWRRDDAGGRVLLGLGFTLGALGGLDTTVREHFTGYRSHTLVLSAFPAVALTVIAALAGLPAFLVPLLTAGVFLAAYTALRRIWDRTSKHMPA